MRADPQGFTSFGTWVDGKLVEAHIEGFQHGPAGWQRWRVKTVRFEAAQVRHVRVSYTMAMGRDIMRNRFFEYRLGTGRSWKGNIGRATVRLRLEYNPMHWKVKPDAGFRQITDSILEWRQQDFEPQLGTALGVRFEAIPVEVVWDGESRNPFHFIYPEFYRGHFWVPVTSLQYSNGAEITVKPLDVTVRRGSTFLRLRSGQPWIDSDKALIRLAEPPFMEHGQLYVPLAAVYRALGADVSYDARSRRVTIKRPVQTALRTMLPAKQMNEALWALAKDHPGWAPPEDGQYAPAMREVIERDDIRYPWLTAGDFNGDGFQDIALFLCKTDEFGILVIHTKRPPYSDQRWIKRWPAGAFGPGHLFFLLRSHPPGEVAYSADGETTHKSGRVTLKHDAIELIAESASHIYYWDAESRQYKMVQTDE